jgi:hypothetical protein
VQTYVLSPHYDDAVLSCYNLLEGAVVIDVFTRAHESLSAWDRLTGATDPRARMLERKQEEAGVMRWLGLKYHELDYSRANFSQESLLADLERIIPPGSRIYLPAGIGSHPSHTLTRDVALLLTGRELNLYADMPYAYQYGRDDGTHCNVSDYWQHSLDEVRTLGWEPGLQTESQVRDIFDKIALAKEYKSQYSALNRGTGGKLASYLETEIVWSIQKI